jgi:hypothetical protein
MTISWNKRRTTKYANDHSTHDLRQTGKATLPGRYLYLWDARIRSCLENGRFVVSG